MQSIRTAALNLSFRVCIGEFSPIWSSVVAIFGLLAAILNCFACCFCVIVSNLNIHSYKHVQIKQPVKISTLNLNFRVLLVKILLYLSLLAAILSIFGGHLGFWLVHQVLIPQIWIPPSSSYAKNVQSARATASNFSFRVCIGEFCPILSSAAAILNFLAAILDFYRFVRYRTFKFEYILSHNVQNHAINKNYSIKFEIRSAPTSKYCYLRVFYGISAAILDFKKCSRVRVSHPVGSYSAPFVEQ